MTIQSTVYQAVDSYGPQKMSWFSSASRQSVHCCRPSQIQTTITIHMASLRLAEFSAGVVVQNIPLETSRESQLVAAQASKQDSHLALPGIISALAAGESYRALQILCQLDIRGGATAESLASHASTAAEPSLLLTQIVIRLTNDPTRCCFPICS